MKSVGLRVKNEGKFVSSYCPFDIERGEFVAILHRLPFILKMRSSSIFEKIVIIFYF